jgi:hypothetical protein
MQWFLKIPNIPKTIFVWNMKLFDEILDGKEFVSNLIDVSIVDLIREEALNKVKEILKNKKHNNDGERAISSFCERQKSSEIHT